MLMHPSACVSVFACLVCLSVTKTHVTLLCRVRWCARLWAASLLPFPKLPALTPRPCWPTPSPWLRTLNARKSYLISLIKRQSEQVREPQCQVNIREGTSDLSEPLVTCNLEGPYLYPLGPSPKRVFRQPLHERRVRAGTPVVWVLISFKSLALLWCPKWRFGSERSGLSYAGLQSARGGSKLASCPASC